MKGLRNYKSKILEKGAIALSIVDGNASQAEPPSFSDKTVGFLEVGESARCSFSLAIGSFLASSLS